MLLTAFHTLILATLTVTVPADPWPELKEHFSGAALDRATSLIDELYGDPDQDDPDHERSIKAEEGSTRTSRPVAGSRTRTRTGPGGFSLRPSHVVAIVESHSLDFGSVRRVASRSGMV